MSLLEIQVMLQALSWGKPKENSQLPHTLNVRWGACLRKFICLVLLQQEKTPDIVVMVGHVQSHPHLVHCVASSPVSISRTNRVTLAGQSRRGCTVASCALRTLGHSCWQHFKGNMQGLVLATSSIVYCIKRRGSSTLTIWIYVCTVVYLPNSHLRHLNVILSAFEVFKILVYFLRKLKGAQWLFVPAFLLQGVCKKVKDLATKPLHNLHVLMNRDRYSQYVPQGFTH